MEEPTQPHEDQEIKAIRPFRSGRWVKLSVFFLLGFMAGMIFTGTLRCGRKEAVKPGPGKQPAESAALQDSLGKPQSARYETPLVKAVYTVRYSSETVEIRIGFTSLYPVKSLVEFDLHNMAILDVEHLEVNDQSTDMIASGFVQFNCVGNNQYLIRLSNKNNLPHRIEISLSQNDISLYRNSLRINQD